MNQSEKKLRIAAFGFRSIPIRDGGAGADKFASELLPRLAVRGHHVVAYNRLYDNQSPFCDKYHGVDLIHFKTINKKGFDTLIHSFLSSFHIILKNTADIIHIQNGGNSIWALILRLFRKKVFISQDGIDWKRDKWPWYGKLYLKFSTWITAYLPNRVIFDNVFAKEYFEKRFRKNYDFIPFGSEIPQITENDSIFEKLGIQKNDYFLFIGRFIQDKGLHYLIPAFEKCETPKKLVLVGGSPNPSEYEKNLRNTSDPRIIFAGFIYGDETNCLIRHAYSYIQPSDVEGLSPVILSVMGIGTPVICSDIPENIYIVKEDAIPFKRSRIESLKNAIDYALSSKAMIRERALTAKDRILNDYSWDSVVDQHIKVFNEC